MNADTITTTTTAKPELLQALEGCTDLKAAKDAYNRASRADRHEAAEFLGLPSYALWSEIIAIVGANAQGQSQSRLQTGAPSEG